MNRGTSDRLEEGENSYNSTCNKIRTNVVNLETNQIPPVLVFPGKYHIQREVSALITKDSTMTSNGVYTKIDNTKRV